MPRDIYFYRATRMRPTGLRVTVVGYNKRGTYVQPETHRYNRVTTVYTFQRSLTSERLFEKGNGFSQQTFVIRLRPIFLLIRFSNSITTNYTA